MTRIILSLIAALFTATTAAAQVAYPPADVSGIMAAIPTPATTIPTMETVGGVAGTSNTYRRGDAVQPRITRSVTCTTVAGGTCEVTWATMQTVPLVYPIPAIPSGATQPVPCYPVSGTITTTGATIKCFASQSILGLGLLPFTTGAAGVTVQVLAIPPS